MENNTRRLVANLTSSEKKKMKDRFAQLIKEVEAERFCEPKYIEVYALDRLRNEFLEKIPPFSRNFGDWNKHFFATAEQAGIPAREIQDKAFRDPNEGHD